MSKLLSADASHQLATLFRLGVLADITDTQLLDRFIQGHKEESEAAFETLVDRHGPMVLRVCQQRLGDRHEAQDAFQAVFLVLARKPHLIRSRDSLGSWLYKVALRTCAKFLRETTRRRLLEQQGAVTLAERKGDSTDSSDPSWSELHDEIARLPEKYQAPIVLCYLEGRTHEEAAAQLHWPLGTVKTRLNRGRERLKHRLSRRGLAPLAELLVADASSLLHGQEMTRVAVGLATSGGGMMGKATIPAHVVLRTEEIIGAMVLSQIKSVALAFALGGAFVMGVGAVMGQSSKDVQPPDAPQFSRRAFDEIKKARVEIARKQLDTSQVLYKEGQVALDRHLAASARLMEVEADASETPAEALGAVQRHLERAKLAERSQIEAMEAGKGSLRDVEDARAQRIDAEYLLMKRLAEQKQPEARPLAGVPGSSGPGALAGRRTLKIRPHFECVVERIEVEAGQKVHKGDELALLFSLELAEAKDAYRSLRAQSLYNEHWAGRTNGRLPETQAAALIQGTAAKSKVECAIAREKLLILGLSEADIRACENQPSNDKAQMILRAPADGIVRWIGIAEGDVADKKTVLFSLESDAAGG